MEYCKQFIYIERNVQGKILPENVQIYEFPNKAEIDLMEIENIREFFETLHYEIENGITNMLTRYIRFPCICSISGDYTDSYLRIIFMDKFEEMFENCQTYIGYVKKIFIGINGYTACISHNILLHFSYDDHYETYLDLFLNLFYNKRLSNPIGKLNSHNTTNSHIYVTRSLLEVIRDHPSIEESHIRFLVKIFLNPLFHEASNRVVGNFQTFSKIFRETSDDEYIQSAFLCLEIFPNITINFLNENNKNFEKVFKKGLLTRFFQKEILTDLELNRIHFRKHSQIYNSVYLRRLKEYDEDLERIIVKHLM
jgi:hypothetical protein